MNDAADGSARLPETPKKAGNCAAALYGHDGGQELDPDGEYSSAFTVSCTDFLVTVIVTFQHDSGPVDEVHVPGGGRLVRRVRDQRVEEHAMVRLHPREASEYDHPND